MNIGVVGARDRTDLKIWSTICHQLRFAEERAKLIDDELHIISGGCPTGADSFAIKYAIMHELDYTVHPAKWKRFGKRAGPIRNSMIAKESDILIAFPNPKCTGTQDTIDKFKEYHPAGELMVL